MRISRRTLDTKGFHAPTSSRESIAQFGVPQTGSTKRIAKCDCSLQVGSDTSRYDSIPERNVSMTRSIRLPLGLIAVATVVAGCSTSPTITIPNPMAPINAGLLSINNAITGPATPTYTSAVPTYDTTVQPASIAVPSYGGTGYTNTGIPYGAPTLSAPS